jgi:hypothetical protein
LEILALKGHAMRLIAVLVALIALAGIAQAEPLTDAQVTERGRALTEQFYKVDLDPVWAACSADLQTRLGGLEAFKAYRLNGVESFGQELKLYDEGVFDQDGLKFYSCGTSNGVSTRNRAWSSSSTLNTRGTRPVHKNTVLARKTAPNGLLALPDAKSRGQKNTV